MITMLWLGSLTGCAWLMEDPNQIQRSRVREAAPVNRSNQVDAGSQEDPAIRGVITKDLKLGEKPEKRDGYQVVVTPVVVDGPPSEFTNSSGVRIQSPRRAKDGGWADLIKSAETQQQRREIQLEQETARRLGTR